MDDIDDQRAPDRTPPQASNRKQDTFWMRRLQEAEEEDPNRSYIELIYSNG